MSWSVRKSAKSPIVTKFEGLKITLKPVTNDTRDRAKLLMEPMPPLGPVALEQARAAGDELGIELERVLQRLMVTDREAYKAAMAVLDWGQILQRRIIAVSLISIEGLEVPVPDADEDRVEYLDDIQDDEDKQLNAKLIAHLAVALGLSELPAEGKEPSEPQSGSTEAE